MADPIWSSRFIKINQIYLSEILETHGAILNAQRNPNLQGCVTNDFKARLPCEEEEKTILHTKEKQGIWHLVSRRFLK